MPDTPLNPDALEAGAKAMYNEEPWQKSTYSVESHSWEEIQEEDRQVFREEAGTAVTAYLAVAQPEVTGEQVNLAGWTCNGIHEPGDYSTCEECRDACDDLARFYNHMMRNPRPFKHWTGSPVVES